MANSPNCTGAASALIWCLASCGATPVAGGAAPAIGRRRFGFDVERAVYLTVLHRLMVSGSDRHASTWQQTIEIPGAEELTLNHAYKAMAWLGENHEGGIDADNGPAAPSHRRDRRGALPAPQIAVRRALGRLLRHHLAVFRGHGGATLGQRGHSKDFRPQLHQVVLGIVLDEHDRPIASFLWPGNTADVTALLPVVERLRNRFGIDRACVVADRGMISAATIAALEARKIDYILGVRERSTADGIVTLTFVRQPEVHDEFAAHITLRFGHMCPAARH